MSLDWLPFLLILLPLASGVVLSHPRASRMLAAGMARWGTILTLCVACIGVGVGSGNVMFGFDRLGGGLAVLIALLGVLVQRFSLRFMQADPGFVVFFARINLLTAVLLAFATAAHLLTLAAGWVMMSLALLPLLRHRRCWHPADAAARQADRVFLIGDLAMLAGVACVIAATGTGVIAALPTQLAGSGMERLGISLIVLAALTKTAILPWHRWLPQTMTAPTPVSAMMHAGFVNAGGILLTRLAGVLETMPHLLTGIFCLGAITALYGSAVMQVQTDVKRQLGASTIGQMGFMLMQCGLGAFAAAMAHLVMHSLFKATLFLGAGTVIDQARSGGTVAPLPDTQRGGLVVWLLVLPVALAGLGALFATDGAGLIVLLFAALVMAETSRSLLRQGVSWGGVLGGTLLVGGMVTVVYAGLIEGAKLWLGDAAPTLELLLTPWHLVMAAVFVLVTVVSHGMPRGLRLPGRLGDWLYVRLLFATHNPLTFAGRTPQ